MSLKANKSGVAPRYSNLGLFCSVQNFFLSQVNNYLDGIFSMYDTNLKGIRYI